MIAEPSNTCELCASSGGEPVWESALCRVVSVANADYPGFCRVILNRHEREMSDLTDAERHALMRVVFAVEAALRRLLDPHKINLASLGNVVPHVHWHVIPRWREDRCYPNPIWGLPQRTVTSVPARIDPARLKKELASRLGDPAATARTGQA
jgi:diadenosine tetraphosphate (Ap4A) HIT family hydrolase